MTRWLWRRATRDMTLGKFSLATGASLARSIRTSAVSLIWVSGCFLTPFPVQSADAANVEAVRLWRAPDHTRVVLDLTSAADFSSLSLENPDRFVVDLKKSRITASLSGLPLDGTPIRQVRSGIRRGTDLRLVFDLDGAMRTALFSLPPSETIGDRIVIDFFDEMPVSTPSPVLSVESLEDRRDIVIAIDPGHGGEDPGASGPGGLPEKKVVLEIAQRLEQQLAGIPGFRSFLTRTGDYYVAKQKRREQARAQEADLFVSIHADAFTKPSANGASVYALSLKGATSATAQYLADSENTSDLIGGVAVTESDALLMDVLADLSMTATLDTSLKIGDLVLEQLSTVARLHKRQVEQAAFTVLKSADVPSILVETGFISNPKEAERLSTPAYQEKVARAIRRGIQSWFARQPPPGTLLAWQRERGGREVTISSGDTLSEIAERFGVSVASIKENNGLRQDVIYIGQTLIIPEGSR